jgi:glycerophosphoryl diester phosphodiesterase
VTRIIAHRGFAGVNPENTVGAVRAAADGADMVEVDVVACADGTPVVFHDARLDGVGESRGITDGRGAVRDASRDEVTNAEVLDSGERVPTLGDLMSATDAPLNVELKRPRPPTRRGALPPEERRAARERWAPFVDRVVGTLDDRRVLYSSFCEGALAAVRDRDPTARVAALCLDPEVGIELAGRYDAEAVHPPVGVDAEVVETIHADGRAVNAWTVRTWREAVDLVEAGVDGLVADYPGLTRWI